VAEPTSRPDEAPADATPEGDGAPSPPGEQKLNGPLHFGTGAALAVGAGLGLVLGTLLDNLAIGLAAGAGIGVVAGAMLESRGRR